MENNRNGCQFRTASQLLQKAEGVEVYLPLINLEMMFRIMLSAVGNHLFAMVNSSSKES